MNSNQDLKITALKKELRTAMKQKRNTLGFEILQKAEACTVNWFSEYLKNHPDLKHLFAYASTQNEVPTKKLVEQALLNGISVYMPKVVGKRTMVFVKISSLTDLKTGAYDILEPVITPMSNVVCRSDDHYDDSLYKTTNIASFTDALMLVPGLAFDNDHNRLGYGGGYYDVFLGEVFGKSGFDSIAFAYDFQLVLQVPTQPHDAKVNCIKTFQTM